MRRFFGLAFALILILPFPVKAQKGQQIFELFLQGAQQEMYRQQQLEQQRQHLNELHQHFVGQWNACHAGDIAACNGALTYPHLISRDRQVLLNKRTAIITAQQEAADRAHRQRIEAEYEERRRQRETAERERANQVAHRSAEIERQRRQAEQAEREFARRVAQEQESASALSWPGSLMVTAVLGFMVVVAAASFAPVQLQQRFGVAWAALAAAFRPRKPPEPSELAPEATASEPVPATPPNAAPDKPRDTAGAIAALELSLAYIQEVRDAERPGIEDVAERKHQLNTLSLATKQLDLAQKLDPDAILEVQMDDGACRFTINELKAEALLLEGITHQLYDIKRAIPALVAATKLNPKSPHAFYVLGLTHAANMSRAKAVAAFEQAVALDPKNIVYRKELNRIQSLGTHEIAAYRATRAGERVFDGSVKAWNIFAVIWNITTFPLRVLVTIFRMLRLHPF